MRRIVQCLGSDHHACDDLFATTDKEPGDRIPGADEFDTDSGLGKR